MAIRGPAAAYSQLEVGDWTTKNRVKMGTEKKKCGRNKQMWTRKKSEEEGNKGKGRVRIVRPTPKNYEASA